MKKVSVFLIALAFVACSSAKKQADSTQTPVTAPVPAPQVPAPAVPKIDYDIIKKEVCESGDDKRSLEVHKKTSGCELSYTKFGKAKIVSSGKYGTKHCEDSFDKITKKLEAQKFSCNPS